MSLLRSVFAKKSTPYALKKNRVSDRKNAVVADRAQHRQHRKEEESQEGTERRHRRMQTLPTSMSLAELLLTGLVPSTSDARPNASRAVSSSRTALGPHGEELLRERRDRCRHQLASCRRKMSVLNVFANNS